MSVRRSSKGRDMVMRYITARVHGFDKTKSARLAGYKQPNSRVTNIEKTNNFREITSKILGDNSINALDIIRAIREGLDSQEFKEMPLHLKVKMALDITNIQKNLSPDLRIKETIDDKGKITRTMWNTASPMQSQSIVSGAQAITSKELDNKGDSQGDTHSVNVAQYTFSDVQKPLENKDTQDPTPDTTA